MQRMICWLRLAKVIGWTGICVRNVCVLRIINGFFHFEYFDISDFQINYSAN
jgi:hypothetical protein